MTCAVPEFAISAAQALRRTSASRSAPIVDAQSSPATTLLTAPTYTMRCAECRILSVQVWRKWPNLRPKSDCRKPPSNQHKHWLKRLVALTGIEPVFED